MSSFSTWNIFSARSNFEESSVVDQWWARLHFVGELPCRQIF